MSSRDFPFLRPVLFTLMFLAVIYPVLASQQPMDRLILWGEGYRFGVQEPEGWLGDWQRASALKSNIIFYPKGHKLTTAYGMIRVRVNKKRNEDAGADLAADMDGYRKKFPTIEFLDLRAEHPHYPCFPKLFLLEEKFHEYVAYVNPGKEYWYMFSVAINTGKNRATDAELDAFRTVVASLLAIDAVGSSDQPDSLFQAALKAADENVKSKQGKKYDTTFALKAGPWLAPAMARCTKGLPETELEPFTVLIRVSASGQAEEILVHPMTKVAICLKPLFVPAKHPKPPGPSWWVKMDIVTIR
ncbi:MAG: hypothetical protein ABSG19_13510 [Candidatus Aminicenantales bacterium]